jgi:hypothetical protein
VTTTNPLLPNAELDAMAIEDAVPTNGVAPAVPIAAEDAVAVEAAEPLNTSTPIALLDAVATEETIPPFPGMFVPVAALAAGAALETDPVKTSAATLADVPAEATLAPVPVKTSNPVAVDDATATLDVLPTKTTDPAPEVLAEADELMLPDGC